MHYAFFKKSTQNAKPQRCAKLKICVLFFLFLFLGNNLHAYAPNPYVNPEVWNKVSPFFLPEDHPIKPRLDKIFLGKRVTQDSHTLKAAGFKKNKPPKPDHAIVSKHSKLKGYLVKLFADEQPSLDRWEDWYNRILSAYYIQKAIDRHNFHHLFKVPKKWIYPLPAETSPSAEYSHRQNFILVVEDMKLVSMEENLDMWKHDMTLSGLKVIYTILQEEGLIDSVYPDNLSFSQDGRLAFVDTQHSHIWPVPFERLSRYLSSKMRAHWNILIANGK